jgi:hypothetical protein
MMMNTVNRNAPQTFGKVFQGMSHEIGGDDDGLRRAEVKSFARGTLCGCGSALQELFNDLDKPFAQIFYGSELSNIHAGQAFRKAGLVAGGDCPVGEVIGKTLADEVMFLQGSEAMLENRGLGTLSRRIEKLAETIRLLSGNAQQVG